MAGSTTGAASVFPTLLYDDAKAAIKLLTEALGFTAEAVYEGEDGTVMHAELSCGNGRVMLGSKGREGIFAKAMREPGPPVSTWWSTTPMRTTRGRWSTGWRS